MFANVRIPPKQSEKKTFNELIKQIVVHNIPKIQAIDEESWLLKFFLSWLILGASPTFSG